MKELRGDLFNTACEALCISTNGYVKHDGRAVMGRGYAHRASQLNPELPAVLGRLLTTRGNCVQELITKKNITVCAFPVKPDYVIYESENDVVKHWHHNGTIGSRVPGFAAIASIPLITKSAHQLVSLTNKRQWTSVILSRPGCGAGELDWETVRPVVSELLDDRFTCMTF